MDGFRDGKILYGVEAHLKTTQQRVLEALDCVVNSRVTCDLAESHIEKSLQLIERARKICTGTWPTSAPISPKPAGTLPNQRAHRSPRIDDSADDQGHFET